MVLNAIQKLLLHALFHFCLGVHFFMGASEVPSDLFMRKVNRGMGKTSDPLSVKYSTLLKIDSRVQPFLLGKLRGQKSEMESWSPLDRKSESFLWAIEQTICQLEEAIAFHEKQNRPIIWEVED